ncbi:MAG TPA: dihydrodipicolinate synthase family protein [Acidobacteriota bacterium]
MSRTALRFEGVFSVLATPFSPRDQIDEASLRRIVDRCIAAGVDGLTALGVTSEVGRLSEAERAAVRRAVLDQAGGRVPVVVGATAEGRRQCIEASRAAQQDGAAAVMISPPRLPKLHSDAVVGHYRAVAEAIEIPIVVQDYPPVSGFAMEPALLVRIAREVPSVGAIKLEDPPTPLKTARILDAAGGAPIRILGGLGGVYLLEELLAGAAGAMTGFAFPEILVEVVRRFRAGAVDSAAELFYRYVALMRFEFQEGIGLAIRKEVLRRRGALVHAAVRPPATTLDPGTGAALDRVLKHMQSQPDAIRFGVAADLAPSARG